MQLGDMMKRLLRGGAKSSAPQHYSGARVVSARAFSHARSLTAAAVALAMMASVAVTAFIPTYSANAEGAAGDNGGICTPQSITLGTDTGHSTEDTGVATYVGGDMYVGKKTGGNMLDVNGPSGSYAVEAEGLTAVKGKLLMHPLKGAWATYFTDADGAKNGYVKDYRGFRFGVVGFGGQYRPKDGSVVLDVKGDSNDLNIGWVKGAQAWGNAGWVGKNKNTEPSYSANIAGDSTTVYGGSSNQILGNGSKNTDTNRYDSRNSVYVPGGMEGTVSWKQTDETIGSTNEKFSDFDTYIKKLSNDLSSLKGFGSVYVTTATYSSDSYNNLKRTKYDVNEYDNGSYTFTINNVNEKVIKFQGDGKASMQVFNLPASFLNDSSSYTGVSFDFSGIPDSASVVINVTGKNVDFHNGWRFWWTDESGTKRELGGSYADSEYAKRARQIMWNFADATNVVIHGGQGSGTTTRRDANSNLEKADGVWDSSFAMETKDDPAAGMLGSILVPNGSFESHVSTNGRVWVGGDFSMYNPDAVGNTNNGTFYKFLNYERSYSASALDMDQERHNLPWNGSYSTSCAAIAWDKVDDTADHNSLGGTSWTVYGTKDNAVAGTNALATIADGGWNDDADAGGSFKLGNLAMNGTYFLRESGTVEGYTQNTNIYQINTGSTTDAATTIVSVFDSTGNAINTDADKLLTDGKIINKKSGSSIEWQKVDGEDNSTLLAGSSWTLSKMNGDTAEQTWTVNDDQSGTEVKSITITDATGNAVTSVIVPNATAQKFTAIAYDQNGQAISGAKLTWSSDDATVASVSQDGTVTPTGNGNTTITVKSADGKVSASFAVAVSGVTVVTSIDIAGYADGDAISLEKGKTLTLSAIVKPDGNSVTWASGSSSVSLSATTGTNVTVTANSVTTSPVTITAKETQTGKTSTVTVNVTARQYLTLYFQAQNNWPANNVKVHYRIANSSEWADINMTQMDGSCSSYAYVDIPLTGSTAIDASSQFGFKYINGDDKAWYGASGSSDSVPKDGNNFKFTNSGTLPEVVVISAGPSYSTTAPSGCEVTSTAAYRSRYATARNGEHRTAAAVLRTQGSVLNAADENAGTKADEDTAAGKFKVSDLADGTYHLQEKTAPNGYEVSRTVYTITIADGTVTWNPSITDAKIANTRKTGAVTWTKVSSDPNKTEPLPGSEWILKRTKIFSWANGVASYAAVTPAITLGTVTDCVNGENNVSDCSAQTGSYVDLDGTAGKFKIGGLAWGEYELVETVAPDGYNLDTTAHKFTIGPKDSTVVLEAQLGNIKNQPGVVLPGTGGDGNMKTLATGLLVAMASVATAGLALKVRRRRQ